MLQSNKHNTCIRYLLNCIDIVNTFKPRRSVPYDL